MNSIKQLTLLKRQLADIQSCGDKIIRGDNSSENFRFFSQYSTEMLHYISSQDMPEKIKNLTKEIPVIRYQALEISLWQYMVLPYWFLLIYKDYVTRKSLTNKIAIAKNKYATMQLYIGELIYDLEA